MMNDIAIKIENLSKVYKLYDHPLDRLKESLHPFGKKYHHDYYALNDVSFEIRKGETVGIIGRNGAGKSTLLKIITGVLTPSSGTVYVNGRIASLLELGAGFNPEMTGLENVFFSGTIMGFSRDEMEMKLEAILAFADIGEFIHQPVKTYSSGMYVRLAFAINVAVEPEILIVDEALAVGDALFQKRCYQHMEKLVANGTTLLFVSHEQESIRTLTNRAILLNHGKIDTIGTSAEVILEYRRQLHEEEKEYYKHLVVKANEPIVKVQEKQNTRSDKIDFGDKEAQILSVEIMDQEFKSKSTFYPNEIMYIKVVFVANVDLKNLNIAVRIRNKEGIKIYSWGTLNQDILLQNTNSNQEIFWAKEFHSQDNKEIFFKCKVNLGSNFYEVQSSISFEEYPYYGSQHILDWKDEAAFFNVVVNEKEYFFGGVCDMNMEAIY
ncbi:ABC transporter ATP-binding protein [Aliarcobacter butzleri]|uniref:ABC transporter ATP-binding protein n=1 Tax=Aliarcobacter butzleri TaxID=28197 RepID=UPI00125F43CC|nr:ABC transporter ATP-binding protein [Aliarcobacter butzleri]